MKNQRAEKKLSLEDFKKNVKREGFQLSLNKIGGGILGDCHNVYCTYIAGATMCCYFK